MQALEFTIDTNVVRITIERNALDTALVAQINEYLEGLMSPEARHHAITSTTRTSSIMTATELRRLPPEERKRIIAEQFANASALYSENPDAIVDDTNDWSDVYAG